MKLGMPILLLGVVLLVLGSVAALAVPAVASYQPHRAPMLDNQAITAKAPWQTREATVLDEQVVNVGFLSGSGPAISSAIFPVDEVKDNLVIVGGTATEVQGYTFNLDIYDQGHYNLYGGSAPLYSVKGVTAKAFAFSLTVAQARAPLYFVVGATGFLGSASVRISARATWIERVGPVSPAYATASTLAIPGPNRNLVLNGEARSPSGDRFDFYIVDAENFTRLNQGQGLLPLYQAKATPDATFSLAIALGPGSVRTYYFVVEAPNAVDKDTVVQVSSTLNYEERPAYFSTIAGGRYMMAAGGVLTVGGLVGLVAKKPKRAVP